MNKTSESETIDEASRVILSGCCGMASPPDTSVTSTSFSEDRNVNVNSFPVETLEPRVDEYDGEVTSSSEIPPSGNACCSSPLFEVHADESMTNLEDIDSLQATLSPLDSLLLADLTGCSHSVAAESGSIMPEFCINQDHFSLKEQINPMGSSDSLLTLAENMRPLPDLEEWSTRVSDVLSAANFPLSDSFTEQSHFTDQSTSEITLLEQKLPDIVENVLALPEMLPEVEYANKSVTDVMTLPSPFSQNIIATSSCTSLASPMSSIGPCHRATASESIASLSYPFVSDSSAPGDMCIDLSASDSGSSMTLMFDSTVPVLTSMALPFNTPVMSAPLPSFTVSSGTAIIDSMTAADLDANDLQELFQSTRLNHDIFLAAGDDNQAALMLNDESIAIDSLDDLGLIDLDGVADNRDQKGSGFPDESFTLDDSDWTCVENWSSSIMNHSSIDSFSEPSVTCEMDQSANDTDVNNDCSSRRHLRRSSRIQDNELRDLAQKIRQENQLKERLENEQLSTVEESSVATADNSKLVKKMMACGVELERVEIPCLEKPSKSLKFKRKFSTESSSSSLKDSKKSKIDYIDECITEASEEIHVKAETATKDVKVEESVIKEKRPKDRCRKFKSYSVTLSTEESSDGSCVPGKLKIKLRKIADGSPNSSPQQIAVVPKDNEISVDLTLPDATNLLNVHEGQKESENSKDVVKGERSSDINLMLSSTASENKIGTVEKHSENSDLQMITKSSNIKKVGIVKPVPKKVDSAVEFCDENMTDGTPFDRNCVSELTKTGDIKEPSASQSNRKLIDGKHRFTEHSKSEAQKVTKSSKADTKHDGYSSKSKEKKLAEQVKTSELKACKSNSPWTESKEVILSKKIPSVSSANSRFMVLEEKSEANRVTIRRAVKDTGVMYNKTEDKVRKSSCKDVVKYGSSICRGHHCKKFITAESVYCSDKCLQQHVLESVGLFSRDVKISSQTTEDLIKAASLVMGQGDDRIVVFERSTGKLVTGPHAPTISTLLAWIRKHPSFEVVQSSQSASSIKKTSKEKSSSRSTNVNSSKDKSSASYDAYLERVKSKRACVPAGSQCVTKTDFDKTSVKRDNSRPQADFLRTTHEPQQMISVEKKDCENDQDSSGRQAAVRETAETLSTSKTEHKKDSSDASRQHVRKGLCRALSARVPELNDVSVSRGMQLKRLAEKIEAELCNYYSGVNSLYQRKYRALVSHLTDSNNQGLFRRVIYSYLSPAELVQINSQLLGNERWSQWPPDKQSSETTLSTSVTVSKSGPVVSCSSTVVSKSVTSVAALNNAGDRVSLVSIDSTSYHGQHVFDVNCRICKNSSFTVSAEAQLLAVADRIQRAKEVHSIEPNSTASSFNLTKVTRSISDASKLESSSEVPANVLPTCSVTAVKHSSHSTGFSTACVDPRQQTHLEDLKNKVITTNSPADNLPVPVFSSTLQRDCKSAVENLPVLTPAKAAATRNTSSFEITSANELIWSGSIVAQDVATIKTSAYRVSGSMKIMKNELPESLTVMGRIPPDIVCDYLNKIRRAPVVTREIAIVFFTANDNESDNDGYDQLFKYLVERQRCAVFGSIGDSIKDMYIWPLARKSCVPSILLPFTKPGLPIDRKDILLGVVVQHLSNRYQVKRTLPLPQIIDDQSRIAHSLQQTVGSDVIGMEKNVLVEDEHKVPLHRSDAVFETSVSTAATDCTKPVNEFADDEPYEPMDDDSNTCQPTSDEPIAEFMDSKERELMAGSAISTEHRLLSALGDKSEVERFTVCIDKLLTMVKQKSGKKNAVLPGVAELSVTEFSDQKRQLLRQLNSLIERKTHSSTVQDLQVVGSTAGITPANKGSTNVIDACGTEMDKFLAWKTRLEGLSSHKSVNAERDLSNDDSKSGSNSYSCEDFAVPCPSRVNNKYATVVEQADIKNVIRDSGMSIDTIKVVADEHSAGNNLVSSEPISEEVSVISATENPVLLEPACSAFNRVLPDVNSQLRSDFEFVADNKQYDLEQGDLLVGSPISLHSPASDENTTDDIFPPLPTPPKPPENLLKINFDYSQELPINPPVFSQFRDTTLLAGWCSSDSISSVVQESKIVEAEQRCDSKGDSFSPASPPTSTDCDYADYVRTSADEPKQHSGSGLIEDTVPSLSMPPYLLAAPLNSPTMQNAGCMAELSPFSHMREKDGIKEKVDLVPQSAIEGQLSSSVMKSSNSEFDSYWLSTQTLASGKLEDMSNDKSLNEVKCFQSSNFENERSICDDNEKIPGLEYVAMKPGCVLETESDTNEGDVINNDEMSGLFTNLRGEASKRASVGHCSQNNFNSSSRNLELKMSLDARLQQLFSTVESSELRNTDKSHYQRSLMSHQLDTNLTNFSSRISSDTAIPGLSLEENSEADDMPIHFVNAIKSISKGNQCKNKKANTYVAHSSQVHSPAEHCPEQCEAVYSSKSSELFLSKDLQSERSEVSYFKPIIDSCTTSTNDNKFTDCHSLVSGDVSWNASCTSRASKLYRSKHGHETLRVLDEASTANEQVAARCLTDIKLLSPSKCSGTSKNQSRYQPSNKSEMHTEYDCKELVSVAAKVSENRVKWLDDNVINDTSSSDSQTDERDWKQNRTHGLKIQRHQDSKKSDRRGRNCDSFNQDCDKVGNLPIRNLELKGNFYEQSIGQRLDEEIVSPVVREINYLPAPPRVRNVSGLVSPRPRDFLRDARSIPVDLDESFEERKSLPVDSSFIAPFIFARCTSPHKRRSSVELQSCRTGSNASYAHDAVQFDLQHPLKEPSRPNPAIEHFPVSDVELWSCSSQLHNQVDCRTNKQHITLLESPLRFSESDQKRESTCKPLLVELPTSKSADGMHRQSSESEQSRSRSKRDKLSYYHSVSKRTIYSENQKYQTQFSTGMTAEKSVPCFSTVTAAHSLTQELDETSRVTGDTDELEDGEIVDSADECTTSPPPASCSNKLRPPPKLSDCSRQSISGKSGLYTIQNDRGKLSRPTSPRSSNTQRLSYSSRKTHQSFGSSR